MLSTLVMTIVYIFTTFAISPLLAEFNVVRGKKLPTGISARHGLQNVPPDQPSRSNSMSREMSDLQNTPPC